jgi:hypothetical protein
MDDFGTTNPASQRPDKPVRLDNDPDAPIPFEIEEDSPKRQVSHAPLNLGGGPSVQRPKMPAPQPPKSTMPKPVAATAPVKKVVSTGRITGIKTFFTKLHPGAIDFLDEQIAAWLRENPDIEIKQTNVNTGEVQAKKTEPNIIITVWY